MSPLPAVARRLVEVMVDVYPDRVRDRLGETWPEGMDAAVEEGQLWLARELEELLSQPFIEQRRGPLEVFQAAMSFPTARLEAAGVEPARRDQVAEAALPGDVYDLAPASSSELGDDAWSAHLQWGAAKAAAVRDRVRPPEGDGGR